MYQKNSEALPEGQGLISPPPQYPINQFTNNSCENCGANN